MGKGEKKRRGEGTHALEVHRLHRFVHAFYDARHVPRHLSHRHGRLDPAREAEEVQRFALLADRVGGIYPYPVVVALLERLHTASPSVEFLLGGYTGEKWGRRREKETRDGDGEHAPSLVVPFRNSHIFGAFFACRFSDIAVNYGKRIRRRMFNV